MYYIASPYSHIDPAVREQRYKAACAFTAACLKARVDVFSPIVHSHPLVEFDLPNTWEFWQATDTAHIRLCDAMIVLALDGWLESKGVTAERKIAEDLKMPVIIANPSDDITQISERIAGYLAAKKHIESPSQSDGVNPKDRIGLKKPRLDLIPPIAELLESMALGLGAGKYGPWNWRQDKPRATIYVAAARRHLLQWLDGEDNDKESGVSHLAHVRACMSILLDAQHNRCLVDDRPATQTMTAAIETLTRRTETAQ